MGPGREVVMLIPILGLLIGGFAIFVRSHLGHALAERIAGRSGASAELEAEVRELRTEVEALRGELGETQERLDFTERMIAGGSKGG
jgi:septal ring factor EnvC (AmiA/AmiB activator)